MSKIEQENWFVLDDKSAVDLWLKGKDVWNEFVEKHNYNFDVDFSGVDFSENVSANEIVNFNGFLFPNGTTSFSGSGFGNKGASFKNSELGNRTLFALTNFGDGNLVFEDLEIEGSISFDSLTFEKGCLKFNNCEFNDRISLYNVNIGEGQIEFSDVELYEADLKFCGMSIGHDFIFNATIFSQSSLKFVGVNFKETVSFEHLGPWQKEDIDADDVIWLKEFMFRNCEFHDDLIMPKGKLFCRPDFGGSIFLETKIKEWIYKRFPNSNIFKKKGL